VGRSTASRHAVRSGRPEPAQAAWLGGQHGYSCWMRAFNQRCVRDSSPDRYERWAEPVFVRSGRWAGGRRI